MVVAHIAFEGCPDVRPNATLAYCIGMKYSMAMRQKPDTALCMIARDVDEVSRCVTRLAPSREISLSAFGVLATLEAQGPLPVTELALRERIRQPSMTALVSRLERQGLVRRGGHPGDARVVLVEVTVSGLAVLHRRRACRVSFLADLIAGLDAAERRSLLAAGPALRAMVAALRASANPDAYGCDEEDLGHA